jgi:hypothetical protein
LFDTTLDVFVLYMLSVFLRMMMMMNCMMLIDPFLTPWQRLAMGGLSSDVCSAAIEAAFAAAPRDDTKPWGQRAVMYRPALKVNSNKVPTALFGEGWALLLWKSHMRDSVGWAFVRFVRRPVAARTEENIGEVSFEPVIYDLHAFLEAIANLGPPAPMDEIKQLQNVFSPQSTIIAAEIALFVMDVRMRGIYIWS